MHEEDALNGPQTFVIAHQSRELGVAYLFITHIIGVVEYMADPFAAMQVGHIVEQRLDRLAAQIGRARCARLLAKKLAVRAKSGQPQDVGVWLAIDQHQIGFDMTVPVACPFAAQVMIAVPTRQRQVIRQGRQSEQQGSATTRRRLKFLLHALSAHCAATANALGYRVAQKQPLASRNVARGDQGIFCKVDDGAHGEILFERRPLRSINGALTAH